MIEIFDVFFCFHNSWQRQSHTAQRGNHICMITEKCINVEGGRAEKFIEFLGAERKFAICILEFLLSMHFRHFRSYVELCVIINLKINWKAQILKRKNFIRMSVRPQKLCKPQYIICLPHEIQIRPAILGKFLHIRPLYAHFVCTSSLSYAVGLVSLLRN